MPSARLRLASSREPLSTLGQRLRDERFTASGDLYHPAGNARLRCVACAHRCVIGLDSAGACGVRFNHSGELRVPFGYVARRYLRSVETNTVFHVLPGARALTFGMYGCDLRCPYCHNHRISQALRDGAEDEAPSSISAEALVEEAASQDARVLCAAYNEPMISAEWTRRIFELAQARGLRTALITDGHTTPEALRYMRPHTDVFRVDLKAHTEAGYKQLGARLQPVLDGISLARELGYWVEVVTLVVPGINHEQRALSELGGQLREISPLIPWHLNGFVPRYRLESSQSTSSLLLTLAAGAAYVEGTKFVYVGNVAACRELAHTRCPECHTLVIRRHDYQTISSTLRDGACPSCSAPLPGVWS
jgi:pyruvate formate lyase activating enzyme